MRPLTAELRAFYTSPNGRLVRRMVGRRQRRLWPDLARRDLLAVGYPLPFLDDARADRANVVMLETQGAEPWIGAAGGRVVLAREDELPFADSSFERILLIHALENARHPNRLLREAWRVLADGGRLLAVVPNRHGLWCWSERTPFGSGRPFSVGQLDRLLESHFFAPIGEERALYLPPLDSALARRLAPAAERLGPRLAPRLAGLLLREAEKRIYALPPVFAAEPAKRRRYVRLPQGAAARDETARIDISGRQRERGPA